MIKIGLTGGLCSGKSLAAARFNIWDCFCVDCDDIVRKLYEKNEVKDNIRSMMGPGVISRRDGVLRNRIFEIIFSDEAKKRQLEQYIHPLVFKKIKYYWQKVRRYQKPCPFIVEIPLLAGEPWGASSSCFLLLQ